MTREEIKLAIMLARHPRWEWKAGTLVRCNGHETFRLGFDAGDDDNGDLCDTPGAHPDLGDWATVGALLSLLSGTRARLVRERRARRSDWALDFSGLMPKEGGPRVEVRLDLWLHDSWRWARDDDFEERGEGESVGEAVARLLLKLWGEP